MIFVKRHSEIPEAFLKKAEKELTKVLEKFIDPNVKTTFEFSAYSDGELKKVLLRIFNEKCAYCESRFRATYPGDIEHFRPKGEVILKVRDPGSGKSKNQVVSVNGYYWMAADWENLLISCKLCNQELTYEEPDGTTTVMGKKNQFPVSDEAKRIRKFNKDITLYQKEFEEEEKIRLIINPCKEDPSVLFKYDGDGSIEATEKTGKNNLLAENSIRVYALQRMSLVHERKEVLTDIQAQQGRILEIFNKLKAREGKTDLVSVELSREYKDQIEKELTFLKERYLKPEQPYLGMATQVIAGFLKQYFNIDI